MFAPSSLAQWFGAVGTIAAVVVALFKDSLLAWKRRPRLNATCTKETPYTSRTPIVVHDGKGAGSLDGRLLLCAGTSRELWENESREGAGVCLEISQVGGGSEVCGYAHVHPPQCQMVE